MPRHRFGRAALVIVLGAMAFPLIPASTASAERESSSDPRKDRGLLGTEARGTGVLPNFEAKGSNLIRLQAGAFDPLSDPLPSPAGIQLVAEATLPAGVAQYWLVQVRDDQFPAAKGAVTGAGGSVAGYLHDDTYVVRATPAQRAQIDQSDAVRWTGYLQPAWRVPAAGAGFSGLMELDGTRTYQVHVFAEDPNPSAVGQALSNIPGVDVISDAGVVVEVRATKAQVPAMAALPAVEWITLKPKVVPLNANARWVNDTGIRDLYSATAPGRLTGAGQTAAVADSGLNYTYDLNKRAHIAFRDCDANGVCKEAIYTQQTAGSTATNINNVVNHSTGHRKMVAYFDIGNSGPNPYDPSSHGSHTAGSVDGDRPPYDKYTGEDGLAPAANHVHQNIGTTSAGLAVPGDLYDLFRQAYRPRNPAGVNETSGSSGNPADYRPEAAEGNYRPLEDARTHNNSWGVNLVPIVDPAFATRVDEFVWDHEDMAIVFSAGNGGPAPSTIISPSVAKNDMSSGASANGRQPMVSIDSMARFSSHGPTGDQRFGVDLATPGQIVVSVKGGTTDGYHTAQGTSMSGPVLTGLATLVRQYFFDGYAVAGGDGFAAGSKASERSHNPSAALVKATLVNGAERMRGYYTGTDGRERGEDGEWPSGGQGFGRVNLANSLYFAGDPSNNWYVDVFRGDTDGDETFSPFPESELPQTRTYELEVGPGEPLDVTLAWTDAPNVLPAGTPALVNNLDLVVTGPEGQTYVGNNMNSRANPSVDEEQTIEEAAVPDTRNPTERVRVANPDPGTYTVTVNAGPIAMGNQGFALAASGNISAPEGASFEPGPPLQVDQAGNPRISGVKVTPISSNTAKVRFRTNEPTTATADVSPAISGETFVDSYNEGIDGFAGDLGEGPVETSEEYADKPVVGKKHEMLLTGFSPGQSYSIRLQVKDLADNSAARSTTLNSPGSVFQPKSDDTGQCFEDEDDCQWDSENAATQLYAGESSGAGALGAFMFRTQGIDPADITMATVEMVSAHNWVVPYTEDPILYVDLLPETLEPNWGTQDYQTIHNAPADARALPETTHKRGAYYRYAFTFGCGALEKLKNTLENGNAAFRWDSSNGGLFSMDFGFNRRSRGPDLRPRLVLYTSQTGTNPTGERCDAEAPAPTITNVGIHGGLAANSVTVSWETLNVESDSIVLFREKGTTPWTQVGTPARTKVHQVQVFGLNETKDYEFAVRSAACNGATTTDTNGGEGYNFFRDPVSLGTPTTHATFDFEAGPEGWTETTIDHQDPDLPADTEWRHGNPGASDTELPDGSRPEDASKKGWTAKPYFDSNEALLTSPPVTFTGTVSAVEFWENHDLEQGVAGVFTPVDALKVEVSRDGGTTWQTVAQYQEQSRNYPNYIFRRDTFPTLAGQVQVRFNLFSDNNTSFPPYEGAAVDKVSFVSYSPPPTAELPFTGPVPPPSAGATGLTVPRTRTGTVSASDRDAGTGYCQFTLSELSISKTDRPDPTCAGDRLKYRVRVANRGVATAYGVQVTDNLPAGTELIAANPSQGSCTGTTCNLGTLEEGASANVVYTVRPSRPGTITNTASVSTTSAESRRGNNSASETTTVRPDKPDLKPVRITLENHPRVGKQSRLATKIGNNGCKTARNVLVEFRDEQGRQIGTDQTIEKIAAGDSRHATVPWTPRSSGRQTVTVIVDPNDSIDEIVERNNTFSRTYRVRRA